MHTPFRWFAVALMAAASMDAVAGCGSAFCSLNTDWNTQGAWAEPGGRFDLRYEFIDQDQPRTGTRDIGVGEIPQHHDEIRTINRNWIAGFDYTFNSNWGIGIQLPVVIHNHMGAQLPEAWNFTELGDARVVGRYRFVPELPDSGSFGLQFGLKLPTGKFDVANDDGDVAERSLQPGSGTTDAIVGAYYSAPIGAQTSWFFDVHWTSALSERDGYKPGDRVGIDTGVRGSWTPRAALLLQLNAQWKDRDSGTNAEPETTGGTFVFVSPGIGFNLGYKTQVYSFIQLPVYQNVHGVQLVADWTFTAGVSRRF